MKREIKFRVWNGLEMDYEPPISLISTASVNDFFNDDNIMQYTGFKDKNGKEIYEGDVIFNHAEEGICNSNIIIFSEYGYFLQTYFSETRREIISLNEYLTTGLEVIGNIHENPELINP